MGRANTEADFWARVNVQNNSECWNWLGCVNNTGHGYFTLNWKTLGAHVWAWIFINGEIENNLYVLHDPIKCSNKLCCNPAHLRLGTQTDNMRDPDFARLNWNIVNYIRFEYAKGEKTQKQLADELKISTSAVYSVINHRTWKEDSPIDISLTNLNFNTNIETSIERQNKMAITKQQLVDQIYTAVMEAGEPMTRKEICDKIGYHKSPHIIAIIDDLVRGGWLIQTEGLTRNGLPVFKYFLNLIKAEELEEYRMRA